MSFPLFIQTFFDFTVSRQAPSSTTTTFCLFFWFWSFAGNAWDILPIGIEELEAEQRGPEIRSILHRHPNSFCNRTGLAIRIEECLRWGKGRVENKQMESLTELEYKYIGYNQITGFFTSRARGTSTASLITQTNHREWGIQVKAMDWHILPKQDTSVSSVEAALVIGELA